MKSNEVREREYVSNEGLRMRVYPYGFGVRAAVCDEEIWPTSWFEAENYERAIRIVTERYGTAWRRVELTHIGW